MSLNFRPVVETWGTASSCFVDCDALEQILLDLAEFSDPSGDTESRDYSENRMGLDSEWRCVSQLHRWQFDRGVVRAELRLGRLRRAGRKREVSPWEPEEPVHGVAQVRRYGRIDSVLHRRVLGLEDR